MSKKPIPSKQQDQVWQDFYFCLNYPYAKLLTSALNQTFDFWLKARCRQGSDLIEILPSSDFQPQAQAQVIGFCKGFILALSTTE